MGGGGGGADIMLYNSVRVYKYNSVQAHPTPLAPFYATATVAHP